MFSSVATLLALALVAVEPPSPEEFRADVIPRDAVLSTLPTEQLESMVLEALPPPPSTVVRETRYYGTVTIDHRAHLARRAACKTCHGPGAVTKLEFTPKVAHDRCIGCHQELAKGPISCQGCHVKRAPPPQQIAAVALVPVEPPPAEPDAANVAAALAAHSASKDDVRRNREFHRWVQLGFLAGSGQGFSVRVASHQRSIVLTQSIERLMSGSERRTLGLLGVGLTRPMRSRTSFEALAIAGFDAIDRPTVAVLPAVGGRAGVTWRSRLPMFREFSASLTSVFDLGNRHASGREVGGTLIYGTVATGFTFPPK